MIKGYKIKAQSHVSPHRDCTTDCRCQFWITTSPSSQCGSTCRYHRWDQTFVTQLLSVNQWIILPSFLRLWWCFSLLPSKTGVCCDASREPSMCPLCPLTPHPECTTKGTAYIYTFSLCLLLVVLVYSSSAQGQKKESLHSRCTHCFLCFVLAIFWLDPDDMANAKECFAKDSNRQKESLKSFQSSGQGRWVCSCWCSQLCLNLRHIGFYLHYLFDVFVALN